MTQLADDIREPSPEVVARFLELARNFDEVSKTNRLIVEHGSPWSEANPKGPYWWAIEFHNASRDHRIIGILSGNRVGKTREGGAHVAHHLTGIYPDWWEGRRFTQPVKWMGVSVNYELARDVMQTVLIGRVQNKGIPGDGWIPKELLGPASFRNCGIPDVLSSIRIKHSSGGWSEFLIRSFEQDPSIYQGIELDGVWWDEEPRDSYSERAKMMWTECWTRLATRDGLFMLTRTPLFGNTPMVSRFLSSMDPYTGQPKQNKTFRVSPGLNTTDIKHMTREQIDAFLNEIDSEQERECRRNGTPMLGSGRVFMYDDDQVTCDPFPIPDSWPRIVGIDIGIEHPTALVWHAYDRENDAIYTYDAYRAKGRVVADHAQEIIQNGQWIPVAWPHDALKRGVISGKQAVKEYKDQGCNMLYTHAQFQVSHGSKAGALSVEDGNFVMDERIRSNRWKIFNNERCGVLLEEMRSYHRDAEGKLVKERDDAVSAARYGIVMIRHARTRYEHVGNIGVKVKPYTPMKEYA